MNEFFSRFKPSAIIRYSIIFLFFQCQSKVAENELQVKGIDILYSYVNTKDQVFDYELIHEKAEQGYRYYVIKMTSQNWLSKNEVDEPTWWHWVSFVIPDNLEYNTSFMMVSGGSRDSALPKSPDNLILEAALATKSTAIKIHNIPFQPISYQGDTLENRKEDGLIAYGWREFMERGARDEDAIWLARFPMTKAVVSAMDAVVDFTSKELGLTLGNYVVAGGSKRGWTTWTTAAVDDRVVGMAPIVIDMLNLAPSFKHHWQTYGFWAPAVKNYEEEKIFEWLDSEEFQRLLEITEPYHFLERYQNIPKLLLNASGDQFFLPDSWQFYWEDLPGEKHLAYFPNADHSLRNTDAMEVLLGFYSLIIQNEKRPNYLWEVKEDEIFLKTDPNNAPVSIKIWEAHNETSRDFRMETFGPEWKDTQISINAKGEYHIPISAPEKGWKGHFVEFTYSGNLPIKFTTGLKVLPETYPFEPFVPENPKGNSRP